MNIDMHEIRLFARVLLNPAVWLQVYPYSKAWDRRLRHLLSRHRFTDINGLHATLGADRVWIGSRPLSHFTPANVPIRPSRRTILLAQDLLQADVYGQYLNGLGREQESAPEGEEGRDVRRTD